MRFAAILAPVLLGGCATSSVTLLPDEGGGQGAVAVLETRGRAQESVIDQGNSRTRLGGRTVSARSARLSTRDQQLLGNLPPPPVSFMLYFDEGTTQVIPTSRPQLDALLAEASRRPGVEVQISGHTDRKGSDEDNDRLSEERARAVLEQLVQAGIPRDQLVAVGRGERDPRVPTEDGVDEIANRRVEIVVR